MSQSRQSQPGKLKHLYLKPSTAAAGVELTPRLYLEARVDYADVRSGLHETCTVGRVMQTALPDRGEAWTSDMLLAVDPAHIKQAPPPDASIGPSPDWFKPELVPTIESQFLEYLLRTFRVRVYRNFELNIYSRLNESLEEFRLRCAEMLSEPFRLALDAQHELFDRLLEQTKEKLTRVEEWAAFDTSRVVAQQRGDFRDFAERITSLFMHAEFTLVPQSTSRVFPKAAGTELNQSLASLELDARYAIGKVLSDYQQRASNIDEYIIHPNFRDIHLVRSCLLWMPGETP
jgi:hypothetical protein